MYTFLLLLLLLCPPPSQLASAAGAFAWTSYSLALCWGQRLTAAAIPLLPVATADTNTVSQTLLLLLLLLL
jgi:hypothetical protein